jgi:membrane peptidoglycan carboxypeptidase
MRTSLSRRQRHRRLGTARRPTGGGAAAAKRAAIAIPLVLFASLIGVGLVAFLGAVSAYGYYSEGLPDPRGQLQGLRFDQQTVVYDRTGETLLARLGDMRRELATFDQLPPEMLDATTAIEDKDFWSNPGFDLPGFIDASLDTLSGRPRGGSTITQQLVRARLLPPEAFEGEIYERKIREIIQSVRLTQEFEGEAGKREIITAYLNQNFYGNRSYGVKAAAKVYFGKPLDQLSLAQYAILAAIPQSPTRFDLVRNAEETPCAEIEGAITEGEAANCPANASRLYVLPGAEIVVRRNYILDLMKTRSVLSGHEYTEEDYDAAKDEPVILVDQRSSPWRAPHFVWRVRDELATILCPGEEEVETCEAVDTGGFRVKTTLNWEMQRTTEKWVYAAAIAPNSDNPTAILRSRKIPSGDRSWILGLRGRNIHNAAAAVVDYRTGQVLAYAGSASYTERGRKKFQPQFDVLSDGWRQPGSAIKPINYAIGIDAGTMTASTMFMDVVTNFASRGQKAFTPTQADGLERGPVRLRSALQFSLNIPAIKATLMHGLNNMLERNKEFGLRYLNGTVPVTSMGIGTLEVHPIDLLGGYATIANNGVKMPRRTILEVLDSNGQRVWPTGPAAKGKRIVSAQAAYIITDILAGNTDKRVNPYWGEWQITDRGRVRPAAYKTGTTSDNRDVHAYGYLAPPRRARAPALAVGVWMGNSDNSPNNGSLSLDSSAPLWSAILTEISRGMPMARFETNRPGGLVTATVDAHSGLRPGPFTTRTVRELFIEGSVPRQEDNLRVAIAVDGASGGRWAEGCAGPRVVRGFLSMRNVEQDFPQWGRYNRNWASRAPGRRSGGPEGTRPTVFYNSAFAPFGLGWGAPFAPSRRCTPPAPPPPTCQPIIPPVDPSQPPTVPPDPCPPPTPPPEPDQDYAAAVDGLAVAGVARIATGAGPPALRGFRARRSSLRRRPRAVRPAGPP